MSFSDEPIIKVENTNIYQEDDIVLEDISFSVYKGEFVYMLGRTGSGKSSLLKTLYADLFLDNGSVEVAGYQIRGIARKNIPLLRRKLGIVFQDFELFTDRSVTENLEFVLKATGWTNSTKMKQRIVEVLMRVGLDGVGNKMPHQLSGGEQQRIVIARALLNEPLLLIADEPTGNLDPEVAENILNLFIDINKSGTSIVMATHNHGFLTKHPARTLICKDKQLTDTAKGVISEE